MPKPLDDYLLLAEKGFSSSAEFKTKSKLSRDKIMQVIDTSLSDDLNYKLQKAQECYNLCIVAISSLPELKAKTKNIQKILLFCADICELSINLIIKDSYLYEDISPLIAQICTICSKECSKFPESPTIKQCGKVCLEYAKLCIN